MRQLVEISERRGPGSSDEQFHFSHPLLHLRREIDPQVHLKAHRDGGLFQQRSASHKSPQQPLRRTPNRKSITLRCVYWSAASRLEVRPDQRYYDVAGAGENLAENLERGHGTEACVLSGTACCAER